MEFGRSRARARVCQGGFGRRYLKIPVRQDDVVRMMMQGASLEVSHSAK